MWVIIILLHTFKHTFTYVRKIFYAWFVAIKMMMVYFVGIPMKNSGCATTTSASSIRYNPSLVAWCWEVAKGFTITVFSSKLLKHLIIHIRLSPAHVSCIHLTEIFHKSEYTGPFAVPVNYSMHESSRIVNTHILVVHIIIVVYVLC